MNKFRAPRSPAIAPLFAALFFVVLAVMAIADPETGLLKLAFSWIVVVVCGGLGIFAAWSLVFPAAISLDEEGFTQFGPFGMTIRIPWSDVAQFYVRLDTDPRKCLVGWTYAEGRGPGGGGDVDALDGPWPIPADKLVELMQSRLEASRR
ncbi:MAG: hypothetical protein EON95_03865 [Caulobacteraceae bacterium]|nr:MAG: hypothetical protein EON95_03865 [Caulobacteraceae bacterium]